MELIDWGGLVTNGLWIFGLACCLAALSIASWESRAGASKLASVLDQPRHAAVISLGLMLCSLGLAVLSDALWERAVWGVLCVISVVQVALIMRGGRGSGERKSGTRAVDSRQRGTQDALSTGSSEPSGRLEGDGAPTGSPARTDSPEQDPPDALASPARRS